MTNPSHPRTPPAPDPKRHCKDCGEALVSSGDLSIRMCINCLRPHSAPSCRSGNCSAHSGATDYYQGKGQSKAPTTIRTSNFY